MRKILFMGVLFSLVMVGCKKDHNNDDSTEGSIKKLPSVIEAVGVTEEKLVYDDNNRLITYQINIIDKSAGKNETGKITYEGDRVTKLERSFPDEKKTVRFEFPAVTEGEFTVKKIETKDGAESTSDISVKVEKGRLLWDSHNQHKFTYDERGNMVYASSYSLPGFNIDIDMSYGYDTSRKGIFRNVNTPNWLLNFAGDTGGPDLSPNLVSRITYHFPGQSKSYEMQWKNFKDGYPETMFIDTGVQKLNTKISYQLAK